VFLDEDRRESRNRKGVLVPLHSTMKKWLHECKKMDSCGQTQRVAHDAWDRVTPQGFAVRAMQPKTAGNDAPMLP
jgi:hypothetical protein